MNNQEVAHIFYTIADLLEIRGEDVYKTRAYRRAADNLNELNQDVNEYWRQGKLTEIPGVGQAIAKKIDELLTHGQLEFLEKLKTEIPMEVVKLLEVPDLGPKRVALIWRELGITSLAELENAASSGRLRDLPGLGSKSEARILAGIQALKRRSDRILLGKAWPLAQETLAWLQEIPGVQNAQLGGSLRRMRDTVGDIDLLVATRHPELVMKAFVEHKQVARVLSQGATKSSIEFHNGMNAQLWAHPPKRFGTALQFATGSKNHNVRLREHALFQGLSLSDQAITLSDGGEMLCAAEEQVYATLGLPWIPPELREDRGEIKAARDGKLPSLITLADMTAELHAHTTWSDGGYTILEMAQAALQRGLRVLAITEHSQSLGVARGLSVNDLRRQRREVQAVQDELGDSLLLLHGIEVEIRADGALDYPDEVLAELDIVIAALHTSLRQPRAQVTQRLLNAVRNPHVDIIAHPTARLLFKREAADVDLEAVLEASAETGVSIEINANPHRLDLDDIHTRRAIELGIPLCINTDAHSPQELDYAFYGV
ncbi:MAG: DNA polymerase/3'-5' exonuclease PolX, partial [Chloroflexota bacterium]